MSFRSPRKTWRRDGHPRGLDAPAAATHPRMNGVCTYRKGLLGAVATTVIDGDADGRRELLGDARGLELLKGEATTETRLEVVALGRGVHDGAESTGGGPGVSAFAFFSRAMRRDFLRPAWLNQVLTLQEVVLPCQSFLKWALAMTLL